LLCVTRERDSMNTLKGFSLKRIVAGLEDGIIVLSGPALAISGIIAGVDLVTGGNILKNQPGLTLAWAITLLLTLDFQVLCLGVRAHRVYASGKGANQKVFEIILAVIVAIAISYVSIQMQSIIARVNAESITLDTAAAQLGINTIALIWERSTLVLVLIFMSGWLREHDNKVVEMTAPAVVPQSPNVEELLDKLDARYQMRMLGMQAHFERSLERTVETVKVTLAEATNPQLPVVNAPARAEIAEQAQSLTNSRFASKEQEIARALQEKPDMTAQEVVDAIGCTMRTAEKWLQRLKQ